MRRIIILGVSAGVGKSSLAKELGKILNLEVYHLDKHFWKPNWIQAHQEEFCDAQREMVNKQSWIIEGNYSSTYHIREVKADTIIYLELPLIVCLFRVVKRWIQNIGKTRSDMGEGCKEKLDWQFIKFIVTTFYQRKKKMKTRLKAFQSLKESNNVYVLKSKKDIANFLTELQERKPTNM
ncbi:topology modulation protein [Evansella sp. AB-P1]|uniref:topology modulation protein n=1 Tax=Evansella sp. AB-P1 TaxID=3037653 RepID=UPI00241ED768|nr:topology modulation protein [Evansella sp. AB-P1]MDG5789583.1 topology modulation protein [Evansella sp. AB-P1]